MFLQRLSVSISRTEGSTEMPRTEEFIIELRLDRDLKGKCGKADGMLQLMDLERNFAHKILVNCQLFYEK